MESVPPSAPDSTPKPAITPVQVNAFAELLGEPVDSVTERLHLDQSLIPVAVAAAEARLSRRSSGKWMMVGGFSLVGIGGGAVIYAFLHDLGKNIRWCDQGDPCTKPPMSSQDKTFMVVGVVASVVGWALAIPGIVMVARQTDIENEAVNRYRPSYSDPPPIFSAENSRPSFGGPGGTLSLSLLSFTF